MYRVKQFIWAVEGSFKKIDYNFIEKYLTEKEIDLFKRLKKSEQHHCIRVCNNALIKSKEKNLNNRLICRLALLHDLGKIKYPLNIIDKSVIVILDKITKGNLKKHSNNKRIHSYYYHPNESVKLLKTIDTYEKDFLNIIENHHKKINGDEDIYLKIIKESDDLS